ncbi:PLAC8 domain-containing protein [Cucumis melo var. makuwa]|uniref:PLAC8 domain-containing protein n=1 Tax=Cucumis melo var. makuwa TaxID=1194695 RepID=A0A5D3CXR6_CUCMM|nr:PLAC8 domain-containing protein [Cucumis melo var. makuwa]
MTCQDMCAVQAICLVVAGAEKVNALNFVCAQRYVCYPQEVENKTYSIFNLMHVHLIFKVFLCFGNSVASTRFLLQDEFNIQTTQCDNCIIGFMFCLQQIACIFSIVALIVGSEEIQEASQLLSCLADMVYCSVCACMQTQHKIEMDKRDGMFGPQVMAVPPAQYMSRIDQPIPPSVGYPQPAYGQPAYPQPQGYPAPGYPQPGYPPTGYR